MDTHLSVNNDGLGVGVRGVVIAWRHRAGLALAARGRARRRGATAAVRSAGTGLGELKRTERLVTTAAIAACVAATAALRGLPALGGLAAGLVRKRQRLRARHLTLLALALLSRRRALNGRRGRV